ncbi:uncharacterized protein LOC114538018 [Dendronephthya gigantea]|uniref:uncharacterized protein LOC114538018 n=1 Tax=Dendronephthya gigantea TaxID=151771 RepID=UPI00106C1E7C|nr:uncharacterized protein LOC114538018 [Dendronephthya gigantea]
MTRGYIYCLFLTLVIISCEGSKLNKCIEHQVCPVDNNAVLGTEINFEHVEENSASYDLILNTIRRSLVANGVVVIRNQTMNRVQQCDFTRSLGSVVVLPESFEGKDPEPGLPAIQRVTNYFHNGTWKGKRHCFGCYWHKDGDFQFDDYIGGVLYAEKVEKSASTTMFLDNCAAYDLIPQDLRARIQDTIFSVSVRDIPDFKNGTEKDFALFPDTARHPIFYNHPGSGRRCLYLTNTMVTLRPKSVNEMTDLQKAWDIMITQAPKYQHYWTAGDVVIWDNLAVMHKAGEKRSGYSPKDPRMLFRTQYRIGETAGKK